MKIVPFIFEHVVFGKILLHLGLYQVRYDNHLLRNTVDIKWCLTNCLYMKKHVGGVTGTDIGARR
jgi:hypothetical protein